MQKYLFTVKTQYLWGSIFSNLFLVRYYQFVPVQSQGSRMQHSCQGHYILIHITKNSLTQNVANLKNVITMLFLHLYIHCTMDSFSHLTSHAVYSYTENCDVTPFLVWHTWASDMNCNWGILAIFARLPSSPMRQRMNLLRHDVGPSITEKHKSINQSITKWTWKS